MGEIGAGESSDSDACEKGLMPEIVFIGRVLPEVRSVSVPPLDDVRYTEVAGETARFGIRIGNGKIRVVCTASDVEDYTFKWTLARAQELCTTMVDAIGFCRGWSLHVLFDEAVVAGERRALALGEVGVRSICTAFSTEHDFEQVWKILLDEFELRFAFRDLVSSLGTLNYSAIASARAIEAVRHLIADPQVNRDEAWRQLREKLNVERAYLKFITDASVAPRHGLRGKTDGAVQMAVTRRAWTVMNRYLEFRKRGGAQPLPLSDFPTLTDEQL